MRAVVKSVKLVNAFQSNVGVHCKGVMANGRSILSLVCLAAKCETVLALEA
jgi:phosphotransferase system HPr-like phosphotransfer protein